MKVKLLMLAAHCCKHSLVIITTLLLVEYLYSWLSTQEKNSKLHKPTVVRLIWLVVVLTCMMFITLRKLSFFSKFFPFQTLTSISAADILATVRFLYPKLGPCFRHKVLLLSTCLPGLESPQVLHRTNSNAVFSIFWQNWGKHNGPQCMLLQFTKKVSTLRQKYTSTHYLMTMILMSL